MSAGPSLVHLENECIALTLAADFGARIVELRDKRTCRNWVIPWDASETPSLGGIYGAPEAKGWDECFPTVATNERCDEIWGERLRDHGELWGRRWSCSRRDDGIEAVFQTERFLFRRDVCLSQNKLCLSYEVENHDADDISYMWSQHCLLKAEPGEQISIAGLGEMEATFFSDRSDSSLPPKFQWPPAALISQDLTRVHGVDCGLALKAYAPAEEKVRACVSGGHGALQFEWTQDAIPYLGLWLDYGGWPEDGPVQQIAIEPTTAMADSLDIAMDKGQARALKSGAKDRWGLEIALFQNIDEMDIAS